VPKIKSKVNCILVMNVNYIFQLNLSVFSFFLMIYVISFDFSSLSMQSINHLHKRLSFNLNTTMDMSIKNYFLNSYCIKYSDIQQSVSFFLGQFSNVYLFWISVVIVLRVKASDFYLNEYKCEKER